jgi:hypothetical protein
MHGLLRNKRRAYLYNLQCSISDECLRCRGVLCFCGRFRRVSCDLKRVVLGETLRLCVYEAAIDGSRPKQ